MKKFIGLLTVSVLGGLITLGVYKAFFEKGEVIVETRDNTPNFVTASYNSSPLVAAEATDFTVAAEKTVHAVVHVTNRMTSRAPMSLRDLFYGNARERTQVGTGSGVIISPDGYIVTNNHVIDGATELSVTLNNNKTYTAELIGSDPSTDIALIKVDADEDLPYLAFGDSDGAKVGEWVLAVGNPFNLTSTVTAGIISAKSRDLSGTNKSQSFIQTDAAVNPGNSGGALVNTRGDLIGINTAITSRTGTYIGYAFAVPSNIAKKVVEDLLEYGNVQKGLLGVSIIPKNSRYAVENGINDIEGVYVGGVEEDSGAEKAGITEGDIIKNIDDIKIRKFADLTGYLNSKRPGNVVKVTVDRDGKTRTFPVKLSKINTFVLNNLGMQVKNISEKDKKRFNIDGGVKITRTSPYLSNAHLEGRILVEINGSRISNVEDAKEIASKINPNEKNVMLILNEKGEAERYLF
ncbi:trypsin-like peptidase domain-containing protein [Sinomicrobium weinanense]|uniref:Trypsin-like peptidase domain-containing protein n=1 Tax=Sinomicrobium weinanense TaxID=2842200 RepID=A0A926JVV4_9FLAO|nr:trypsin-like peptidase domain-containing protein [Sinomicrobium weinanense]MBC9798425.1 trypsin-like peptidase domain-containing protein [Sinomicrobium weinanense]MBU3122710.1 trypsin-like peptidase domain-containing protein [Sinomicrobium weinanense]